MDDLHEVLDKLGADATDEDKEEYFYAKNLYEYVVK